MKIKKNLLIFLSVFITYFVVDVAYQVLIGIERMSKLYQEAGIEDIFANPPNHIYLLFFFFIITISNMVIAVIPAIEKKSLFFAFSRSFLLGLSAYGTLALVMGWLIKDYPLLAVLEITFEGIIFSPSASVITAWLFIRKKL